MPQRAGLLVAKGKHQAGWENLQASAVQLGLEIWFCSDDPITFRNFISVEKKTKQTTKTYSCKLQSAIQNLASVSD